MGWKLIRDWFIDEVGRPLTSGEVSQIHDWVTGSPTFVTYDTHVARSPEDIDRFMHAFKKLSDLLTSEESHK